MQNHTTTLPERSALATTTREAADRDNWIARGRELLSGLIARGQDVEATKRQAEEMRAALELLQAEGLPELPWKAFKRMPPRETYAPRRPWTAEDDETLIRLAGEQLEPTAIGKRMERQVSTIKRQLAALRDAGRL